jgi:hypothetical protein
MSAAAWYDDCSVREWMSRTIVAIVVSLALLACATVVSFDDYGIPTRRVEEVIGEAGPGPSPVDAGTPDGAQLYAVRGTVTGLGGAKATLSLNATPLEVTDGAFAFTPGLPDGARFSVTVSAPSTHTCVVGSGEGAIASGDVSGVAVSCARRDASLASLTLSITPIPFAPATLGYRVPVRTGAIIASPTTTVTATVAFAGATLTIDGGPLASGAPSAPIALAPGSNTIDIAVTAPDGTTTVHYAIDVVIDPVDYIKASNTLTGARFGNAVAISGDTLVVGAYGENGAATGVGGNQALQTATGAGAVYVFTRSGATWTQQAYIKASNARPGSSFGAAVALEGDTLVVGAHSESSHATGVGGDESDTSMSGAGAAYVFERVGATWTQKAYLKASNTRAGAAFGAAVAVSGNTIVVGSSNESSGATGVDGDQSSTSTTAAGAVYVFERSGATFSQSAYVKASDPSVSATFGRALALEGDTFVVGGWQREGAYVFVRSGASWVQQVKLTLPGTQDRYFGAAVALSGDSIAVGGFNEGSPLPPANPITDGQLGAVWIFTRAGAVWSQEAYLVASNRRAYSRFGYSVAIEGDRLLVGAQLESSASAGLDGDQSDISASIAGSAYVFTRTGTAWTQRHYLKATAPRAGAAFGTSAAMSGATFVLGAPQETSAAKGVDGDDKDTSAQYAGAVYVY